jgi:hypothetical protein
MLCVGVTFPTDQPYFPLTEAPLVRPPGDAEPEWITSWVVSEDGAQLMLEALQGDPAQPPNTHTQQLLLEALASSLSPGRVDVPKAGPPHALGNACRQIAEASDPDLARLASRCEDLFSALSDSAAV